MGRITRIEVQSKNHGRYSIYIDGEFAFGVSEDVLVGHSLRKGMELPKEEIESIKESEGFSRAYAYCINLLSYRMRTKKELADKMIEKGFEQDQIEYAVLRLVQKGYVDDEKYALAYAAEKAGKSGTSKRMIMYKLGQKGIDSQTAMAAVKFSAGDDDEYKSALEAARKKLRTTYKKDDKAAAYRKLGGYLSRRGYPYSIVRRALEEAFEDVEE